MITARTALHSSQLPITDQQLIAAAQQGDQRAFGELVCRYRDEVVGVVYRMCGDWHLAEEAAQEAFLRAWQHLPGYRLEKERKEKSGFRPWIFRIAINAALDALRREKPADNIEDTDPPVRSTVDDPEGALEEKQRASRVRQAVLALTPAYRAVLVLREYSGLSYAEIAQALNIPLGTVMSRLNSARDQLRQSLAGLMEAK